MLSHMTPEDTDPTLTGAPATPVGRPHAPTPAPASAADSAQLPMLAIVVPCYNEEAVLPETLRRLGALRAGLVADGLVAPESYLLLVDDGSKDRTWQMIAAAHAGGAGAGEPAAAHDEVPGVDGAGEATVRGLKLARNAGHQSALLAGLMRARRDADCIVSIDADLQDDVDAIRAMVVAYRDGADVVYGVRSRRDTDTFFKRTTAEGFYKVMVLMGVDIVDNHADFRLTSRRVLDHLAEFGEVNLFLRGIVPLIGFRSTTVEYERAERFAGESKYPLKKMLSFAVDGITSFSITPIRWVTLMGLALFGVSVVAALWAVFQKLFGHTVGGWASLIVSVWFIGGVQLLALGLIGEYVGRIYREVKHRPKYIIETELGGLAPAPAAGGPDGGSETHVMAGTAAPAARGGTS
jgi:glycosyltransferase involved in cell wall biosynthesis